FSSDSTNAARPLFLAMITPYSSGGIMANITYIVNVLLERSTRSLSDLKNRSENSAGRGQILAILPGNSCSIAQKSGEIWTGQTDLQPISFKSDRLLGAALAGRHLF
ncbi:MAG: hypothetical protein PHU46_05730, partial [Rhodocyclaceae bacterium]|nr:hypothetical protein [Rhodocyclaceae bacterium]